MKEPSSTEHYDHRYFEWQKSIGEFGARANLFKFRPHVRASDRVLDYGCGGGFLLTQLSCGERAGIEINPAARACAASLGVMCHADTDAVPDGWADVLISNSALEHVENPLGELRRLRPKLKEGGLIVFSIPHEGLTWSYRPDDINHHLYTWSPMSAGHLFHDAGFEILAVETHRWIWPPGARFILPACGETVFRSLGYLYRWLRLSLAFFRPVGADSAIVVIGRRPGPAR